MFELLSLDLLVHLESYSYSSYMIRASVSHAKNNLSSLLSQVKEGETVVITDRDKPIARIFPIERASWGERIEELANKGHVRLPKCGHPVVREITPLEPQSGRSARVVEALLEERSESL